MILRITVLHIISISYFNVCSIILNAGSFFHLIDGIFSSMHAITHKDNLSEHIFIDIYLWLT